MFDRGTARPSTVEPTASTAVLRRHGDDAAEPLDVAVRTSLGRAFGRDFSHVRARTGGPASEAAPLGSPGRELDGGVRRLMERRFGFDFSGVRIHDDAAAAASADAAGAAAYTIGTHVVFGTGRRSWSTMEGQDLLAHELTHVVQQRAAGRTTTDSTPSAAAEQEATHTSALAGGRLAADVSHRPRGVYCQPANAPAQTAAKTPIERFARRMLLRYGVRKVWVGTQSEQEELLTASQGKPPGSIRISGWRSWSPTETDLEWIEMAFADVAQAFGRMPAVQRIRFFEEPFVLNAQGAAVPARQPGATYGEGQITIYHGVMKNPKYLPEARSTTTMEADLPEPRQEESTRRYLVHELGHGFAEAAEMPDPKNAVDPTMIADYARAVGWVGDALYDIGVPAVAAAIANQTVPPSSHQITVQNWNAGGWIEQPVSRYSVEVSAKEDFAEAIMTYAKAPEVLLMRSPRRYAFIHERRARWQMQLIRPMPPPGDHPLPQGDGRVA